MTVEEFASVLYDKLVYNGFEVKVSISDLREVLEGEVGKMAEDQYALYTVLLEVLKQYDLLSE